MERSGDASDRRRVVLRLTAAGSRDAGDRATEAEQQIGAVLLRMTEDEAGALLVGLRALLRELHEPAADGEPPAVPAHEHGFTTERNP